MVVLNLSKNNNCNDKNKTSFDQSWTTIILECPQLLSGHGDTSNQPRQDPITARPSNESYLGNYAHSSATCWQRTAQGPTSMTSSSSGGSLRAATLWMQLNIGGFRGFPSDCYSFIGFRYGVPICRAIVLTLKKRRFVDDVDLGMHWFPGGQSFG